MKHLKLLQFKKQRDMQPVIAICTHLNMSVNIYVKIFAFESVDCDDLALRDNLFNRFELSNDQH
jgi:hypothetical protein